MVGPSKQKQYCLLKLKKDAEDMLTFAMAGYLDIETVHVKAVHDDVPKLIEEGTEFIDTIGEISLQDTISDDALNHAYFIHGEIKSIYLKIKANLEKSDASPPTNKSTTTGGDSEVVQDENHGHSDHSGQAVAVRRHGGGRLGEVRKMALMKMVVGRAGATAPLALCGFMQRSKLRGPQQNDSSQRAKAAARQAREAPARQAKAS